MSATPEPRTRSHGPAARLGVLRTQHLWPAAAVAVVTFLLAYDQGAFAVSARATTAIAVIWALLLGVILGVWPRREVPRPAWIVAGLLAAFAAWTFASMWWADSPEKAFAEFNRVTLYLAIYVIAIFAGARATIRRWADGLAMAVAAIATVSLISRCFPSTFSLQGFPTYLPGVATRLSFPLGYWNGLAIFVAYAYPLWLGVAVRSSRWWTRGLAVTPFPLFAAVLYLSSSRGGVAAALIGSCVFMLVTATRWSALGVLLTACVGSAAAISVLLPRHKLVDGPLRTHEAAQQGHEAFFLLIAISLGTALVYAFGHRLLSGITPPPRSGRVLLAILVIGLVAGVFASHPARRFEEFKQLPVASAAGESYVQTHLLSGSGSGRWQFWAVAVREWKDAPLIGRGAGSYQSWWAQHASSSYFVRNAHSLYLEVLAELGLIGFALLTLALVLGGGAAIRNTLRRSGEERVVAASLLGVVAAFYFGAGIDWMWQLTVVTAVGLVALGLLTGRSANSGELRAVASESRVRRLRIPRFALGLAALALGWFVLCAQAVPWLAEIQLKASEAAVARSDGTAAVRHALEAKNIQPWAASPYLQLALVQEQRRDLTAATTWIRKAIARDRADWRLWLVASRIEIKTGDIAAARVSLLRAESLNPRSPLFAHLGG